MRKIKFRAWNKQTGNMVYSYEVYPRSMYKFEFDLFNDFDFKLMKMVDRYNVTDDEGNDTYQEVFEAVDADIMQYTGMKDVNGKEIYEGDIVERVDKTPIAQMFGETVVGIVGFNNGSFVLDTDEGTYSMNNNKLSNMCSYRVIGNIYENQELLG